MRRGRSVGIKVTPVHVLPATYTVSLSRATLTFAAAAGGTPSVTPAQEVVFKQNGSTVAAWTASTHKPWLRVSPNSGTGSARLTLSIVASALPAPGAHADSVSIDSVGAANGPLSLPVKLSVDSVSTAPYGVLDTPVDNSVGLSSSIAVTGWALDDVGVAKVSLWRDPVASEPAGRLVYIGDAVFVPGARPDVEGRYSWIPLAYRSGWGYALLSNTLPNGGNGTYKLYAVASDVEGNQTALGTKTITIDNAHAVKPFGALDTPAQGATVFGAAYVNFGWALTPRPATIPTDGSTVLVYVDGVPQGHAVYNNARPDILALFPGYANSGGAVGYKLLDTTQFSDGMHTIEWAVTDSLGHQAGEGRQHQLPVAQPDLHPDPGILLPPQRLPQSDHAARTRHPKPPRLGHEAVQPLQRVAVLRQARLDRRPPLLCQTLTGGLQQVALARKEVEEGPLRQPRPRHNRVHRRGIEPDAGNQLQRRVQHRPPRVHLRALLAGHAGSPFM